MPKLRVHNFAISVDGYGAGPEQGLQNPLGVGGEGLHTWATTTRTFQRIHGSNTGGETGIDDDLIQRGDQNIGAWILGRNMFAPSRGPWTDADWKGWWGPNPPYHCDVFVLTHHARASIPMEGGTTFHFVTDGIDSALAQAVAAAKRKDVRVGGGAATLRAYLTARLIDEMHLAVAPVLLGSGEALFEGLDLPKLGYARTAHVPSAKATHVVLTKQEG